MPAEASAPYCSEKTLDAQYYIWDIDATGRIMADRLIRAADRGVRVRLLLDDTHKTEEIDNGIAALDAHPNIEVRFFNPVHNRRWRMWSFLSDFGRVNNRMHNKLFIMDNAVGIAGGRNIADVYFGVEKDHNFRDLDVVTAGPVVRDLSASFDLFWNSKSAVPIGALVAERATMEDYLAFRKQMTERTLDRRLSLSRRSADRRPPRAHCRDQGRFHLGAGPRSRG